MVKMNIYTKKKDFKKLIKNYRLKGYRLISYSGKLAELKKNNKIIVVEY